MVNDNQAQKSEWELGSGLIDDVDVYIVKSKFGYSADYQKGEALLLTWDVESPDASFDRPIIFSVGSKWSTESDGRYLHHESGRDDRPIIRSSSYGRLIERVCKELEVDMSQYGSPKDARTWEGLGFHLKLEKIHYEGAAERGMKADVERLMPVAFLGKRGEGDAQTASAGTQVPITENPVRVKLLDLAKKLDKEKFETAALNLEGVAEDPDLLNEVMSGRLWDSAQ